MKCKCLRCGRVLKSEVSISRGYGNTCFRIVNYQKPTVDITNEITFLKQEINKLKTLIRNIKITRSDTIERIKITKKDIPPVNEFKFGQVIHEMKEAFLKSEGDYRGLLYHVDAIETIRAPPISHI